MREASFLTSTVLAEIEHLLGGGKCGPILRHLKLQTPQDENKCKSKDIAQYNLNKNELLSRFETSDQGVFRNFFFHVFLSLIRFSNFSEREPSIKEVISQSGVPT